MFQAIQQLMVELKCCRELSDSKTYDRNIKRSPASVKPSDHVEL